MESMSLTEALANLTNACSLVPDGTSILLESYFRGLGQPNGEFPSSLNLLQEAQKLLGTGAGGPELIAELIATDPVAPIRLLGLANSALYARNNPVESMLGVIQQLGFRRSGDALRDFGEPKNYQAVFLGRAIALGAIHRLVLSQQIGLELARVFAPRSNLKERVPLWCQLSRLPLLLLAYIRPNLFAAIQLDQSLSGRNLFERNLKKATGKSAHEMAVNLCDALHLPVAISKMVSFLELPPWNRRAGSIEEGREFILMARASFMANRLADEICRFSGPGPVEDLIQEYADKSDLKPDLIRSALGEAPLGFVKRMQLLGVKGYRLPAFLQNFQDEIVGADGVPRKRLPHYSPLAERINPYLYELRASLKSSPGEGEMGYLPQAVLCTLQALVHALQFDRAVLYRPSLDRKVLEPTVLFGQAPAEQSWVPRYINASNAEFMPDVQAYTASKVVFTGDSIFANDWPFCAFPIVSNKKVVGVFYADKAEHANAAPLETQEQVSVIALAELWQGVPPSYR